MSLGKPEEIIKLLEKTWLNYRHFLGNTLRLAKLDISTDQWLLLYQLHLKQGLPQNKMAKEMMKDPASLSRITTALVKKNLIQKKTFNKLSREKKLYLTPEGHEMVQKFIPTFQNVIQTGFVEIYERELTALQRLLETIQKNFEIKN